MEAPNFKILLRLCFICLVLTLSIMMMNEEQLVASISDKMPDFQISVSDLKSPTAKFLQSYFIRFLQELDVDVERFQLTNKQMATMTCPNSMRHAIPLVQLFGAVDGLARRIYVDLSLTDITQPKPSRTIYILNHFDRFHMYADMVAEHVQEDEKEVLERKQQYKQLVAHINNLQETVRHQGKLRAVNGPLSQEIDEVKKSLIQKRQEVTKLDEEIEEVDSVVENLELKHDKLSSEYNKMNDELAKLQVQIVKSPEVDQMDMKLRNLQQNNTETEKTIQELQSSVQERTRQVNLFKKYISVLGQGTEQMRTIVQLATQNKTVHEKIQALEKRQLSATNKEVDLKDKLAKLNSKAKQLSEQKRTIETAMEQELAEEKTKIQEAEKELAELRKKGESNVDLRKKISEIEQEIEKKVLLNDRLCDLYDALYEKKIKEMNAKLDKLGLLNEE